ncbi:MAG: hypothetical protein GQ564_04885 [Bacteroidales bacterium]|nr:hypothetical protein [Bacteroidales bacterium]
MEISPELIWIFGGIIIVIIAILVAKKAKITFSSKELSISVDKTDNNKMNSNKLVVKGNKNKIKQDVDNKENNISKNNEMEIEGDENELDQDVNNSGIEKNK